MRRQVPVRFFAVAVAAGSLMALPMVAPASAGAPVPQCTKLTSPKPTTIKKPPGLKSAGTVSGCTPTSVTGGGGTSVNLIPGTYKGKKYTAVSTTTWKGGHGTTIAGISYTSKTLTAKNLMGCPKGSTLLVNETGKVLAGTNKAIKIGSTQTAKVCVHADSSATLLPHTVIKF